MSSASYLHFEIVDKIRAYLFNLELNVFDEYIRSESGILIKSQIVDLNRHYRVFFINQVLTNRSHFFKDEKESQYSENQFLSDHLEKTKTYEKEFGEQENPEELKQREKRSAWIFLKRTFEELTILTQWMPPYDKLETEPLSIYKEYVLDYV